MFTSLIEYIAKKLIDLGFRKKDGKKKSEFKLSGDGMDTCRSIKGIWVCQYRYPRMNDDTGVKTIEIETQLVRFVQNENRVTGSTQFANVHPEDFEGVVTNDRFFTGMYFNRNNHHSYHGAFQFIISHSRNRMRGKWVGFNREGENVDSYEWRWDQLDDNPDLSKEKEQYYISQAQSRDLFATDVFPL